MKRFILAALLLCPAIVFPQGAALSPVPKIQFLDNNGKPLANGYLYTYSAGTSSLLPTYTDASGTTQNTDPVRLDSGGFANIWLGNDSYRMVLQDSKGATIWTVDNVQNTGQIQIACAGTPNCFVKLDANGFVPQANLNYVQGATGSVNRTVQNRLQDFISAKDFGAKGDGTTDDTAAIQAALNAVCLSGGTLFFPAGVYDVSSTIKNPIPCNAITFYGAGGLITSIGQQGSILKWVGASGGTVLNVYSVNNSYFHSFGVDGNNIAGQGIWVQADNASGQNGQLNTFLEITVENVTQAPGYGLGVYTLNDDNLAMNVFDKMELVNNTYNIYQSGNQTLGNTFYQINSYKPILYGAYFNQGDVEVIDGTWLSDPAGSAHSLAQIAHIYIGSGVSRVKMENNEYECLNTLNPAIFSNYQVPFSGLPYSSSYLGDKIFWNISGGGKVMNSQRVGPILLSGMNVFSNTPGGTPGEFYIGSNGTGAATQLSIVGGYYQSDISFNLQPSVIVTSNSSTANLQDGVIEGNDANITSGSAVLTIGSSNSFTSSMVGWGCYVEQFTSATVGASHNIATFTDSTHVTLDANAAHSAANVYYRCGRNISAGSGQVLSSSPPTAGGPAYVVDGGNPRLNLRVNFSSGSSRNYSLRVPNLGGLLHLSVADSNNPNTANYSDFLVGNTDATGKTATSVTFPVPLRIGAATNQLVGFFFQDVTTNPGTVAAGGNFHTDVTITGTTVVAGADVCQVSGGQDTPGIIATCTVIGSNQVSLTWNNVTGTSVALGSSMLSRVSIIKFSYTGP